MNITAPVIPSAARVGFAAVTVSATSVSARVPLNQEANPGRRVRSAVREVLALASLREPSAGELLDDVLLVASELVANAVRHGGGAAEARVSWDLSGLTVEVDDHNPALPRIRPDYERGADGGFGLCLVDGLTDAWGCVPRSGGKTVRAHCTPGSAPDAGARGAEDITSLSHSLDA